VVNALLVIPVRSADPGTDVQSWVPRYASAILESFCFSRTVFYVVFPTEHDIIPHHPTAPAIIGDWELDSAPA
jgi:hypothetical protein